MSETEVPAVLLPSKGLREFVRDQYFVSPVYSRKKETKYGLLLDERDIFHYDWFLENTINVLARLGFCSGLIHGKNGVLCQITGKETKASDKRYDPYQRIIVVRTSPIGSQLPDELSDLLASEEYVNYQTLPVSFSRELECINHFM